MKLPHLAILAALSCGTAVAADLTGSPSSIDPGSLRYGVNLGVSTLGPTVEPTVRLNDRFGLRLPIGSASLAFDEESDGHSYDGALDIGGVGLLADFYPYAGGFHVSAGVFKTDYAAAFIGNDIEFDDLEADVSVSLAQKHDVSPALAMGYTGRIYGAMTYSVAAGGIFAGGFDVTALTDNPDVTQADLDEETADIRDLAEKLDVIPYVQLAVGFAF